LTVLVRFWRTGGYYIIILIYLVLIVYYVRVINT